MQTGCPLFPSLLHVILYELFGVFFKDIINFIDQFVDVFLHLLSGFDDLGVRLDLILPLRLALWLLLALLFFHSSTSHRSRKLYGPALRVIPCNQLTPGSANPSSRG